MCFVSKANALYICFDLFPKQCWTIWFLLVLFCFSYRCATSDVQKHRLPTAELPRTGVLNLGMYAPFLWLASTVEWVVSGVNLGGLLMLQAAFGFSYIGARALTLGLRAKSNAWMVPGESR